MLRRVVHKQLSMIADDKNSKEDGSVSQKEVDQFIHHHPAITTMPSGCISQAKA
jgi:hypothetical protein